VIDLILIERYRLSNVPQAAQEQLSAPLQTRSLIQVQESVRIPIDNGVYPCYLVQGS